MRQTHVHRSQKVCNQLQFEARTLTGCVPNSDDVTSHVVVPSAPSKEGRVENCAASSKLLS